MEKIIYIPIDTSIDNTVECNKLVKRGDILTLQIKVFVDGALADLTGESIDLILKKSDGTLIEKNIDTANISNGVITATLSQQASLEQGIVSGEVQIYTADTLTSTNTFTYTVDSSLADDILEISQDDIQVLADLRNLIDSGKVTIEQYKESVLAIGNTVEAVQSLANIKLYIDANLNDLENANAQAVVNIANETIENDNAIGNIEDLTSKNAIASNNISDLDNKNSTASQKISDLDSKNSSATTNISDLDNKNNTAINNIANLNSKNSTATNNISNLQTENTRAEANIVALENFGDATQLAQDVNAVKTELETARGGEANLDARLDKNDDLVTQITASLSDMMNTKVSGTLLNVSANLNSSELFTPGTYYHPDNGHTMYNCPTTDRLKLIVEQIGASTVIRQTIITGNTATTLKVYQRYVNTAINTFGTFEKVIMSGDIGTIASKNYEEGSFTPVITGSTTAGTNTYSVQVGRYTKMGNRVFFDIHVALSAKDANMSGDIRITGLPFAVKTLTNYRCSCSAYYTSMNLDGTKPSLQAVLVSALNYITLSKVGYNNSSANVISAELTDVSRLAISGSYEI